MDQLARIDKAWTRLWPTWAPSCCGFQTRRTRDRRKSDARLHAPSINSRCAPIVQAAEDSDVSFIQWTIAGQYCSSTRLPMNSPR